MSTVEYPPTIFIVHPKENRKKCSVEPLRGCDGFRFINFGSRSDVDLADYVRLSLDGPPLSGADASRGLLILDGTWRLAEKMLPAYSHVPARTLPNLATAYPRSSKLFDDPPVGLATIEALYAAHLILGRDIDGLLEGYRWGDEFLDRNAEWIESIRK